MKNIIFALAWKRPLPYLLIFLLSGYMIGYTILKNHIENQVREKIEISKKNEERSKLIHSEVLKLNPLYVKEKELKTRYDTLKREISLHTKYISCLKSQNNTKNNPKDCIKKEISIIHKVNAAFEEELKTEKNISRDSILMNRICTYGQINGKVSSLCNNWKLYNNLKGISNEHNIPFAFALGIAFAESHIGLNYAGGCNESYNNWGGIKWRIKHDGEAIKDQKIPDASGCWVYKFNSVEDYWDSKMHTLQKYSSCFTKEKPITCISYAYVGNANVAEQSWINRVAIIAE